MPDNFTENKEVDAVKRKVREKLRYDKNKVNPVNATLMEKCKKQILWVNQSTMTMSDIQQYVQWMWHDHPLQDWCRTRKTEQQVGLHIYKNTSHKAVHEIQKDRYSDDNDRRHMRSIWGSLGSETTKSFSINSMRSVIVTKVETVPSMQDTAYDTDNDGNSFPRDLSQKMCANTTKEQLSESTDRHLILQT